MTHEDIEEAINALVEAAFRGVEAEACLCNACNKCFVAVASDLPVRCYRKGVPAD